MCAVRWPWFYVGLRHSRSFFSLLIWSVVASAACFLVSIFPTPRPARSWFLLLLQSFGGPLTVTTSRLPSTLPPARLLSLSITSFLPGPLFAFYPEIAVAIRPFPYIPSLSRFAIFFMRIVFSRFCYLVVGPSCYAAPDISLFLFVLVCCGSPLPEVPSPDVFHLSPDFNLTIGTAVGTESDAGVLVPCYFLWLPLCPPECVTGDSQQNSLTDSCPCSFNLSPPICVLSSFLVLRHPVILLSLARSCFPPRFFIP